MYMIICRVSLPVYQYESGHISFIILTHAWPITAVEQQIRLDSGIRKRETHTERRSLKGD